MLIKIPNTVETRKSASFNLLLLVHCCQLAEIQAAQLNHG
jgi:hypothetical protein